MCLIEAARDSRGQQQVPPAAIASVGFLFAGSGMPDAPPPATTNKPCPPPPTGHADRGKYDSRFAMMLSAPPVAVHASTWLKSLEARNPYSLTHAPTKTPVCVRRNESAGYAGVLQCLAGDLQDQALLGIDLGRFAGGMPKNSASNTSISSRHEPHRVVSASAAATSGDPSSNGIHRSRGTSPIADRRSDMKSHN